MNRSKARLSGNEEEAELRAQGKDIAAEGGKTDEEIDNFTFGPDDMQASPSLAQPQDQPQVQPQAPDRLDLLLDKLDHLQRS